MLCALMYHQNGDLANLLKSARKKSAPECPFECGGGGQSLFGQCPNRGDIILNGAPLRSNMVFLHGGCVYDTNPQSQDLSKVHSMISINCVGSHGIAQDVTGSDRSP